MPEVTVGASMPRVPADEVFAAIADFAAYPRHTDAVREVVVTRTPAGLQSAWWVAFRSGILSWTEQDDVDVTARRIDFAQLDGDFAAFAGSWAVEELGSGCAVRFAASFDLGMPSLAPMIDPLAESAMTDNIRAILGGLLGPAVTFD